MRTGFSGVARLAAGLLLWILLGVPAQAQESPPAEATGEAQEDERSAEPPAASAEPGVQARYADSIDVVAVTPVDAWGVSRDQVPANVQSVGAADLARGSLASSMERLLPSVQLQEAQGSAWQPDVQVRGFSASPLLGVPQGVAVYQDGVRLNDPFGDTVRWDLVPTTAVARLDLLPGSNPLFGFNALGGALLLETKNGFSHPGVRGSLAGGSFGRRSAAVEWGLARSRSAAFLALNHLEEAGWRDFSPARIGQLFAGLSWAGSQGGGALSLSGAANRLHGNGPAPVALLEEDRSAVFTHPDISEPEALLLSGQLYRSPSPRLAIEASAFYRRQRLTTFNGDAASFEPCEEPGLEVWLCREGDEDDPLQAIDGSLIPASLEADAVENRTATDQWSAGGSLQVVRHAGRGTRTSRTAAGITADAGRADYAARAELAALGTDRGTEGFGIELADSRDRVESRIATTALYLLETLSLDARTTLVLSARWQRSQVRLRDRLGTALNGDHSFSRLSPAVGLTRALGSRWTLYGNVGISSRAPTPVELTCADPEDPCRLPNAFVSDPPLDQVVTRTAELGARGSWRGLEASAAAFRTDSRDDILFISSGGLTGSGHFANVGETRRQGAELLLRGGLPRDGSWFVSYSHLRATFRTGFSAPSPNHPEAREGELAVDSGDRLPLLPEHTAKAGFELPLGKALLGASLLHVSESYLRGDEANLLRPLSAYSRLDLHLSHPLGRRLVGFLEVDNVSDEEYATFGLLGEPGEVLEDAGDDPRFLSPGAPRTFVLGLRFTAGK
jgi:iron complex outermembrane recepter protein